MVTLVNRKRWIEDEWEKVIEYQYDEKGQENVVREVGQRISKKYEGYMNMEMELWLHLYRIMSRMVIESERLTEKEKDILRDQKEGMIYGVLYMNHGRIFYKKMIKDVYKWMMERMKDRMVHYSLRNLSNNEIRVDEQKILYPLKENYVDIVMRMCEEVEKRKKSELKAMMMDKVAEKMGESVYQDQKGVRTWVESLRFEEEKKRELGKEVREEGDILASLWDKFKKWREEGKSKDEMMALKEEVMKFKSSLMETQQRMKDARAGGLQGGYDTATLEQLAKIAKEEEVNHVVIEANFGDGMYTELIKPVLAKHRPCMVEEVKHSTQKERRIIDTLEPVMARHKLVFDTRVIEDDYRTAQAYEADNTFTKTLIYQLSRISYDKGSLKHDDRLDALAIAVNYWVEKMAQDENKGISNEKQRRLDEELRTFVTGRRENRLGNGIIVNLAGGEKKNDRWFTLKGR